MQFPISTIYTIDWFKSCCLCKHKDDGSCKNCSVCPYAICGSHESKFETFECSKEIHMSYYMT